MKKDVSVMDKYIALIPVRGGSKSIPLKNIKPINGRPLVYWTLDAAVKCSEIDKIYVSTDSEEIKKTVELYRQGMSEPDRLHCVERDPRTATDTASTESAMLDFAEQYEFEHMVLIQATSPLLEAEQLTGGIKKYQDEGYDSLLSAVRQKRFVWKETAKGAEAVNYDFNKRPRRQEFDGFLVENGAFYITGRESLLESRCRLSGKIGIYEMEEDSYFEIDEPSDWIIVEKLLRKKSVAVRSGKSIRLFVTDCDGVLTDGGMYYTDGGDEMKKFNTLDGIGIALLRKQGIRTAIITGENTRIVEARATKLKIDYLYQGIQDKLTVLNQIVEKEGISLEEVAYIGDDINDVECLQAAGIGISVPNGVEEAKNAADFIVNTSGGKGAVREAVEYLLR